MIGLDNYRTMDPQMLYSIVNMKLRDYYDSLEDLANAEDIEREVLERRLAEVGFTYHAEVNQFR